MPATLAKKAVMGVTGAGTVASALIFTQGTAYADLDRRTLTTYGGRADCTIITDNSYGAPDSHLNFRCDIFDTDADGDSIYVEYGRRGLSERHECAADQNCYLGRDFYGDGAGALIIRQFEWRVCRNDYPFGDPCSDVFTFRSNGK